MSSLRPPTEEEAVEAARLMNEHWPELVDPARVLSDWTSPRVDLERDARIGDGVYVLVEDIGEGRVWIEAYGREVQTALSWAESRAREMGRRRAFTGGWSPNEGLFKELARRGYRRVRSSQRMEIALDLPLPEPVWPDGIEVRSIRGGEERAVYDAHQEAFEDVWEPTPRSFEDWAHWYLQPPRFDGELWFLACDGPEICGVAMCHSHPTIPGLGWVDVLAVRRDWRRRGIGRALLVNAFRAFARRGWTRAGLGVDSESPTGAHGLYGAVGMRATHRFDVYEKELA